MAAPVPASADSGAAELDAARKPYGAEWPPSLSGNDLDIPDDSPSWPGGRS